LTEAHVDDATMAVDLIEAVGCDFASVTADAAYDSIAFHELRVRVARTLWFRRPRPHPCLEGDLGRPLGIREKGDYSDVQS